MNVYVIASEVSDNFFYAVADDSGHAALIDPIDGDRAVAHLDKHHLELEVVVNTHYHHDHIGGNDAVFKHFPDAILVAGATDAERIESQQSQPVERRLQGGDTLDVGDVSLEIFDTPGHTPGHISLRSSKHLFCGDTVFVGGAGNCKFGGDPSVLYQTFDSVLAEMDDNVIFYPGHDYSVRNLEFVLSIEPDNDRAQELLDQAKASDEKGDIFLTTFGTERAYNPFFRYDESDFVDRLASEHTDVFEAERKQSQTREEAAFRTVRELRNRW